MNSDICVYHTTQSNLVPFGVSSGAWVLKTCLRTVVLTESSLPQPAHLKGYEVYRNGEALSFLLEIVCGLRSPLIGETEILGQFKEFVKKHKSEFSVNLAHFTELILREAKRLRARHLQNLGGTSYGSLLRKEFRNDQEAVVFVGAGSLVQDILPWCAKRQGVMEVFTRQPEKHIPLKDVTCAAQLLALKDFSSASPGILVLAAPVSSIWVDKHVDFSKFSQVFDLRGESRQDPLANDKVVSLGELFANLESNQKKAAEVKSRVLSAIESIVEQWQLQERPRPFGWEDLCAYS